MKSRVRKSFTVRMFSRVKRLWKAPSFPIFSSRHTSSSRDGGWCFLYTAEETEVTQVNYYVCFTCSLILNLKTISYA